MMLLTFTAAACDLAKYRDGGGGQRAAGAVAAGGGSGRSGHCQDRGMSRP